jgi:hypothetical protein
MARRKAERVRGLERWTPLRGFPLTALAKYERVLSPKGRAGVPGSALTLVVDA